jgi:two-component system cell cycle sensor histidine kinase/response regulator CckA
MKGGIDKTFAFPRRTILVVEDEDPIRILSEVVLIREGYSVITASDGVEALEKLRKHAQPIDLLISDLSLPRMSGDDLAGHLRDVHPSLPIIFASGSFGHDPFQDISRIDGAFKLLKPFTPDRLLKLVASILKTVPSR